MQYLHWNVFSLGRQFQITAKDLWLRVQCRVKIEFLLLWEDFLVISICSSLVKGKLMIVLHTWKPVSHSKIWCCWWIQICKLQSIWFSAVYWSLSKLLELDNQIVFIQGKFKSSWLFLANSDTTSNCHRS